MPRKVSLAAALLTLTACGGVEDGRPFPQLAPLGALLAAAAPAATPAEAASADAARLAALNARSAGLRRPVLTASERARLQGSAAAP